MEGPVTPIFEIGRISRSAIFAAVVILVFALWSVDAAAQCCNPHSETGEQCGQIDPTISRTAGCFDDGNGIDEGARSVGHPQPASPRAS